MSKPATPKSLKQEESSATSAESTWVAVVNPNAGTRKVARDWPRISEALKKAKVRHVAIFTEQRGDAITMVQQQIALGVRHFIAVGGDGTLNETVNGIFMQQKVPQNLITLALIPVGTGNDWRRTIGIPLGYNEAALAIARGHTFKQDVGRIDYTNTHGQNASRYFANVAGIGYDALVASEVNRKKDKGAHGPLTYLTSLINSLMKFKTAKTTVKIDCETISANVFSLSIGIGKFNGGGMKQLPDAIPDDGLFDLTLVRKISRWQVITQIKNLYDGSFTRHKAVSCFRSKSVAVDASPAMMIEADGESVGKTPVAVQILPQSLRVITSN
ncbi:MAG: diacylglycerol kinase family lipid kinase [Bacteroidales bacterium]|nr:diacylglycerol kinase family lipid kinase [Bacteroidales bacterium]MDD3666227.1 diacylglycerol kinase family lipid kinase [Bacteroidales bacterium]